MTACAGKQVRLAGLVTSAAPKSANMGMTTLAIAPRRTARETASNVMGMKIAAARIVTVTNAKVMRNARKRARTVMTMTSAAAKSAKMANAKLRNAREKVRIVKKASAVIHTHVMKRNAKIARTTVRSVVRIANVAARPAVAQQ